MTELKESTLQTHHRLRRDVFINGDSLQNSEKYLLPHSIPDSYQTIAFSCILLQWV